MPDTGNEIVHPIDVPKQGRFPTAGRPDKCSHLPFGDIHCQIKKDLSGSSVKEAVIANRDIVALVSLTRAASRFGHRERARVVPGGRAVWMFHNVH